MKYTRIALGLMVALGMMTSTVLAQDPLYSESFEAASLTNILEATGLQGASTWSGGVDDISAIVAGTPVEPNGGYPLPLATHDKVLQLDTEGGTLTNALTTAASFENEAVYVDSLIKFVPSEDLAVIDDDGVKMAVYAYAVEEGDNVSTNLAIYHGGVTSGGFSYTTNAVTDLAIDASAWYRLTIVLANDGNKETAQGFKVYINGVLLTNDSAYAGEAWTDISDTDLEAGPDNDGTWFISACSDPDLLTDVASLQFRGTGFVDDLVIGAGDPMDQGGPPVGSYEVTQTVGANGSSSDPTSPIMVTVGQSTNLTYTANEFYRIASLTVNDTAVTDAAGQQSYELAVNAASAIVVSFSKIDTYAGSTIDWFIAQGWKESDIVGGLDYAKLEMLNVAATNAAAGGTITITNIDVAGNDVQVDVLVERTMSLGNLNGVIKLYGTDDLATNFALIADTDFTLIGADTYGDGGSVTKSFTYNLTKGYKFYKAQVQLAE
jgi:hypothetical protein